MVCRTFTQKLVISLISLVAFQSCNSNRQPTGNVLRVAVREKIKSIDPAYGSDYYSNIEITRAYEGLLHYHYTKRPYEIEPRLAEGMPQISQDKTVLTFKIRKGVLFQDNICFKDGKGRELVAEDFVYSFNRILDPKTRSDGKWIFDGRVKEFKAIDQNTLQITLLKPYAGFLHVLTMPYASVVAKECVEHYGTDFTRNPVGTGPFQLERYSDNQIVWKRNPTFRKVFAPDNLMTIPFVDKLVDDLIVEDQPAWLNFLQGNHDYLMKIPKDNVSQVWTTSHQPSKEVLDRGINVLTNPAVDFTYIAFNWDDPVVGGEKNRFLRLAMSLAYDEAPTIDKFYLGLAKRAEFLIPPGLKGYEEKYQNPNRIFNLVKAREILEKAGFSNGEGIPELTYSCLTDSTTRQLAEYFQRSMAQIGIKLKLEAFTWPELLKRIREKKVQMFGISWLYDYPDAENGLQLLYSKNESPGPNEANYKNKEYDALYLKAAPMADTPERMQLIAKMRTTLEKDVPWIMGLHRMETRLTHPWVSGYQMHSFEHNHEQYLKIDQELRKKSIQ